MNTRPGQMAIWRFSIVERGGESVSGRTDLVYDKAEGTNLEPPGATTNVPDGVFLEQCKFWS